MSFLVAIAPILLKIVGEAGAPAIIQWVTNRLEKSRADKETLKLWKAVCEYSMKKNNVAQEIRDSVRGQLERLGVSQDA